MTGSLRVIRAGEGGALPASQTPPGEGRGGDKSAIRLGALGLRKPEGESARENRFQN